MSVNRESGPNVNQSLTCELCNYITFSSYPEFTQHHLSHIRQPVVSLTRLSDSCVERANRGTYRVRSGGERSSSNQVPPITLSVVNQRGNPPFVIIKKKNQPYSSNYQVSSIDRLSSTPKIKMERQEESSNRNTSRAVTPRRKASTRGASRSTSANTVETTPNVTPIPKIVIRDPYVKLERIDRSDLEPQTSGVSPSKRPRIESSQPSTSMSSSDSGSHTPASQVVEEPAKVKVSNGNDSPATDSRKSPRTKYTNRGRKRQQSSQETTGNDSAANQKERADSHAKVTERRTSSVDQRDKADTQARMTERKTSEQKERVDSQAGMTERKTSEQKERVDSQAGMTERRTSEQKERVDSQAGMTERRTSSDQRDKAGTQARMTERRTSEQKERAGSQVRTTERRTPDQRERAGSQARTTERRTSEQKERAGSQARTTERRTPDQRERAGSQARTTERRTSEQKERAGSQARTTERRTPDQRERAGSQARTAERRTSSDQRERADTQARMTESTTSFADQRERADTQARVMEYRIPGASDMADQAANREDTIILNSMELPPMPSTSTGFPFILDLSGKQAAEQSGPSNPMPSIFNLSNGYYLVHSLSRSHGQGINWEAIGGTIIQTWDVSSTSGLLTLKPCVQPAATQAANNNAANSGAESAGVTSTLIAANLKNQDGNVPSFNIPACVSENLTEPTNFVAEAEEVRENLCESMTGDGNDSRRGPQQPNEQAAFWASLQRAVANQNINNQESMMGHSNPISNADLFAANLLHSFLAEHQVQHGPISGDNSEFVSLERLAAQHQQTRYDMNNAEVTTPMEQLTQQVHRMSNPAPQINMIAQHHLQAPPPLHAAGVPLSQASTSYEGVAHMQSPMGPPPLFQGFSMYSNQVFQQQGSSQQVLPRPPALQQYPQLQIGAYQSLAQPQPNRQKSRPATATATATTATAVVAAAAATTSAAATGAVKRSMPGSLPLPESLAPKQRRTESVIKGKSQVSKGKGKGKAPVKPSTTATRTPAKRMDPQLVASILAARGITVTPSTSRQGNVMPRTQQRTIPSSPVLNISSAITITPSSQKKNSGAKNSVAKNNVAKNSVTENILTENNGVKNSGIQNNGSKKTGNAALPASRRHSAPIVNNDIERPERCATVDLTDDADLYAPGPSVNRFVCNECGKTFPTSSILNLHVTVCTAADVHSYKCAKCGEMFLIEEDLRRHHNDNHRYKRNGPNWVIPVIDLDFPGAEDRLVELGINNFIPISLAEDDDNLAIPIVNQNTPRRQRPFVGMSNAIVLGPICSLLRPRQ